jgi:hypothetical protein
MKQTLEMVSKHLQADSIDPSQCNVTDVSGLPETDDQWLMCVFQPPMWINDRSTPYRPFQLMIVDGGNGMILATETFSERPTQDQVVQAMAKTMHQPLVGDPRQPEFIVVDPDMQDLEWEHSGFEIVPGDERLRSVFTELIADMLKRMGPVDEALATQAGVDNDSMSRLYQSAARFYKAAPWMMVGFDKLLKLVPAGGRSGRTWGVTVIGQLGQTIGLSLMEDVDAAREFIQQEADLENLDVVTIQYGEIFEMPPMDLWYLERNNWEVAGQDAYPMIIKVLRGMQPACLTHEEMQMITLVMDAVPQFLDLPRDSSVDLTDGLGNQFCLSWEIH